MLEEGNEHYAIWKHLPAMIIDGKQNAFLREYGKKLFEYTESIPPYREVFNQAMSSYSRIQTGWILEALEGYDFSKIQNICDVGGGQGHLLCSILVKYPQLKGIVLELENVINKKELLWANKMGVQDRCTYIAGNMFDNVPKADAYIMKMILHDWSDDECVKILSNIYQRSPNEGTVFIAEHNGSRTRKTALFQAFRYTYDVCRHRERTNGRRIRRFVEKDWLEECQDFTFSFWTNGSNTG